MENKRSLSCELVIDEDNRLISGPIQVFSYDVTYPRKDEMALEREKFLLSLADNKHQWTSGNLYLDGNLLAYVAVVFEREG